MYTKEDETRQGIAALDGCYIEELCSPISHLGRICTFVFLYCFLFVLCDCTCDSKICFALVPSMYFLNLD